jgi:hypothetical protein
MAATLAIILEIRTNATIIDETNIPASSFGIPHAKTSGNEIMEEDFGIGCEPLTRIKAMDPTTIPIRTA